MEKVPSSHGPSDLPAESSESNKETESSDFEYVSNTDLNATDETAPPSIPISAIGSSTNDILGLGLHSDARSNEGSFHELRPSAGRADLRAGLMDISSGDFINAEIENVSPALPPVSRPTEEEAGIGESVDEPIIVLKPAPDVFHDDDDDEDILSQSSERDVSPKESVESVLIPENNLVKPESKTSLNEDLAVDAGETSDQDVDAESPKQKFEMSNLDEFKEAVEEEICIQPPEPVEPVEPAETEDEVQDILSEPIDLFCKMGLDAWFNPERLHPRVVELVYWRDPKKSGIVFGGGLGVLLSLSFFSLISVVAYLSLLALTGTICFRVYKNVLQAVQKTSDGHPFKDILDLDLNLPQDKVREVTDVAVAHLNAALVELRRLFLVEDLIDSIKFGVLLWCMTYLGSWFNGMTLIIIAFVAMFTLPKVYENNKAQIDHNLDIVKSKLADISAKVKAAVPIGKKPVVEEKKEQ